jgi:hypothetical protein
MFKVGGVYRYRWSLKGFVFEYIRIKKNIKET